MSQEANLINISLLISVILFAIRVAKFEKRLYMVEKKLGLLKTKKKPETFSEKIKGVFTDE